MPQGPRSQCPPTRPQRPRAAPTIGWRVPRPVRPACAPHHPALQKGIGQRARAYASRTASALQLANLSVMQAPCVDYYPGWVTEAEQLFAVLRDAIEWEQHVLTL